MRLRESDTSLSAFCRAFESEVDQIADLLNLSLEAEVLTDFESLSESVPDPGMREVIRPDVAAYDRTTRKLFIHKTRFLALDPDVAKAVLAHEIGHAYCHQGQMPEEHSAIIELTNESEDLVADWLACKWGFSEGLKKERAEVYDEEFCRLLELWPNESEYARSMFVYHQQLLAGIKRLKKRRPTP